MIMNCKHCGAPINEGESVCSACGKAAELTTTVVEESVTPESTAPVQESATAEKKSKVGLIAGICAGVAAFAIVAGLFISGKLPPEEKPEAEEESISETVEDPAGEPEEPFVPSVSYVREEADFTDKLVNAVVANCGESELTNQKLAYYYWREYYTLANNYGQYLYYMMDPTAPFDTQAYSEDTSWDMLFMDNAVNSYHTLSAAAVAAKEAGYKLTDEDQAILDSMEEDLNTYATDNGMENADAYLQASFGPYCDLESYKAFYAEYMLGASYLNAELNKIEITDDELTSYYEENKENYEANGLVKDDASMINVRHILITPEAVEIAEGEEGYNEAVQTAKDAAKTEADDLYAEWKKGDATEESFAALATEHTEDPGSASTGGLYENVYPGQMVPSFNDWCFDESRKEGDTAIVETDYGYHIMYFVGETGESYWHSVVSADYQNMLYSKLCQDVQKEYPLESDLTKAAVYACNTAS